LDKIEKYKKLIASKTRVDLKYVEYIGMQDYDDLGILYYYNILDPNSSEYKSTKVVKEINGRVVKEMDIVKRIGILLQENVSDGIQSELERRSGRIKKDLAYIKKVVKKLSRWAGATDIEDDLETAEEKIETVVKKTDGVLDDMFDGFNTSGLNR
jgi:hypothetical protein